MKEVPAGRYAGPYLDIPFNTYMQSPYMQWFGAEGAEADTQFLVEGFKTGFDIHYEGPLDRKDTA